MVYDVFRGGAEVVAARATKLAPTDQFTLRCSPKNTHIEIHLACIRQRFPNTLQFEHVQLRHLCAEMILPKYSKLGAQVQEDKGREQ